MASHLSVVPPASPPLPRASAASEPPPRAEAVTGVTFAATPRRVAPYVLRALLDAQLAHRAVTLDDLVELFPVRRADLRRTLSALHASDLYDIQTGRLTLRGFAVALAVRDQSRVPIRAALREQVEQAEQVQQAERVEAAARPTIRIRPERDAVRRTG